MSNVPAPTLHEGKVTKAMLEELLAILEPSQKPESAEPLLHVANAKHNAPETLEEITKLKAALECLSPDMLRGDGSINLEDPDGPNWLGCIWAIASLNWDSGQGIAEQWSMKSDRYTEDGFEAAWKAYNPNHPNPIGIGSLYKLAEIQEFKSHGSSIFKEDQERQPVTHAATKQSYNFLTTEQLLQLPPTVWRVKGLLPDCGLAAIYGPSGSGKSFLVIELIARIANGDLFYGLKTKPCPVVYVALEGVGGIAKRIEAYEQHYKTKLPDTFRVVTDHLSLFNADSITFSAAVKDAGLEAGVIVIDTLAQSAPGSDENSSADMGTIISNAQHIQRATNSLVILVHHTGKDTSRGARGHSSLIAALDAAIEVKRTADGRDWAIAKAKDGVDGISHLFKLEVVELGTDEDGDPITSCVAVSDVFRKSSPAQPKGSNQLAILNVIKAQFQVGDMVKQSEMDAIIESTLSSTRAKQRGKEALEKLVELGHLRKASNGYELS